MTETTCVMKNGFKVTILKSEVVSAALPMQEHWLPLSNLDLLLPAVDVSVFFCYVKNSEEEAEHYSFSHVVSVLKKALAQTLVSYYAFGGVLVKNGASEPELLCNNRGVDFIDAYADVELRHVDFYDPDESVEGKLVPKRSKQGVLAVQATELKCGAVVLSCTFSHQIADAYSANMFLVSWAEMARSEPLSRPPSFRRSLLFPRRPTSYHSSVDEMYVPVSSLGPPDDNARSDITSAISRIYRIKSDQINQLQSLANANETADLKRSKLEAFCAYLWKTVASTEEETTRDGDRSFKLGIVVDGRRRLLTDVEDERESKLIDSYFGNVLSIPFGTKRISELRNEPLSSVADEVRDFLRVALTKEHFLGLIDWVEEHRPEPCLAKIYASGNERAVVVSSGQGFPVRKMDFGWGLPAFGSYHFPWGGKSGYVMPMPSPKWDGDWIVYMHLIKDQLDLVETNAGHVFVPLTSDYLFSQD